VETSSSSPSEETRLKSESASCSGIAYPNGRPFVGEVEPAGNNDRLGMAAPPSNAPILIAFIGFAGLELDGLIPGTPSEAADAALLPKTNASLTALRRRSWIALGSSTDTAGVRGVAGGGRGVEPAATRWGSNPGVATVGKGRRGTPGLTPSTGTERIGGARLELRRRRRVYREHIGWLSKSRRSGRGARCGRRWRYDEVFDPPWLLGDDPAGLATAEGVPALRWLWWGTHGTKKLPMGVEG
jgi:hypothetical protein